MESCPEVTSEHGNGAGDGVLDEAFEPRKRPTHDREVSEGQNREADKWHIKMRHDQPPGIERRNQRHHTQYGQEEECGFQIELPRIGEPPGFAGGPVIGPGLGSAQGQHRAPGLVAAHGPPDVERLQEGMENLDADQDLRSE